MALLAVGPLLRAANDTAGTVRASEGAQQSGGALGTVRRRSSGGRGLRGSLLGGQRGRAARVPAPRAAPSSGEMQTVITIKCDPVLSSFTELMEYLEKCAKV